MVLDDSGWHWISVARHAHELADQSGSAKSGWCSRELPKTLAIFRKLHNITWGLARFMAIDGRNIDGCLRFTWYEIHVKLVDTIEFSSWYFHGEQIN